MSNEHLTDAEIEAGLKLAEFAKATPSEYYIAVQREFNAAAREGWPQALREVQRLQAENQELREKSSAFQEALLGNADDRRQRDEALYKVQQLRQLFSNLPEF